MQEILGVSQALSDPTRLRIAMLLSMEELCECQLHYILRIEPELLAQHIEILTDAGLICAEPANDHEILRTAEDSDSAVVRTALAMLQDGLVGNVQVDEDTDNMTKILTCERDELCRQYRKTDALVFDGDKVPGLAIG